MNSKSNIAALAGFRASLPATNASVAPSSLARAIPAPVAHQTAAAVSAALMPAHLASQVQNAAPNPMGRIIANAAPSMNMGMPTAHPQAPQPVPYLPPPAPSSPAYVDPAVMAPQAPVYTPSPSYQQATQSSQAMSDAPLYYPPSGGGGGGGGGPSPDDGGGYQDPGSGYDPNAVPYDPSQDPDAGAYGWPPQDDHSIVQQTPNGVVSVTTPAAVAAANLAALPTTKTATAATSTPGLIERFLTWLGFIKPSTVAVAPAAATTAAVHGELGPLSDEVALCVQRARAGDQNAMALMAGTRENALRGDPVASRAYKLMCDYVEAYPY